MSYDVFQGTREIVLVVVVILEDYMSARNNGKLSPKEKQGKWGTIKRLLFIILPYLLI